MITIQIHMYSFLLGIVVSVVFFAFVMSLTNIPKDGRNDKYNS